MDDHKLKVFCTVAETKSFSKTSEIIHLTQPAVSLQVQALEEMYETKLFDRSGGTVTLTNSGELLYKYAKEILGLYASARRDINAMIGLVKGNLSVGASSTIGNYLLPSVIVTFRRNHPRIWTNLIVGNTRLVIEKLLGLAKAPGLACRQEDACDRFHHRVDGVRPGQRGNQSGLIRRDQVMRQLACRSLRFRRIRLVEQHFPVRSGRDVL